jgi:hypothetical protein
MAQTDVMHVTSAKAVSARVFQRLTAHLDDNRATVALNAGREFLKARATQPSDGRPEWASRQPQACEIAVIAVVAVARDASLARLAAPQISGKFVGPPVGVPIRGIA